MFSGINELTLYIHLPHHDNISLSRALFPFGMLVSLL